jgi:4-amino-4-deoxy-L-arabinose transferase-like glycosyltransferase
MRGLTRHLRTFGIVLSLLLCAVAALFWVRSYWARDEFKFLHSGVWGWVLLSERGMLMLRNYGDVDPVTGRANIATVVEPLISVPHYFVILLCAAVPVALLVRRQRRRPRPRGFPVVERKAGAAHDGS